MKLSVIIVNYNVRYFLSTCLQSVLKSVEGISAEVIVVDNDSSDDSVSMVMEEFPQVRIIANRDNRGFSKANNQAIVEAKGEYLLLLNPDTIVEEMCFQKCIDYMDSNPKTGGLGVKMVDGSGKFLPESKRGLPTPLVAFYKIFGLSRIFPNSKKFGQYHLGYLDNKETHEVDVLSGAFMMLRKKLIDKIGGLDEDFFMYGEDIDLSYRITQAGFNNVYFPETSIIHFKGESTKKSSVNYVIVFYRAMIIFARKHFSNQNARLFSLLIHMAVYLRATIALVRRLFERIYIVAIDIGSLYLFLRFIKLWYESKIVGELNYYSEEVELIAFPVMIATWIGSQAIFSGYRQPVGMKSIFKGLAFAGTLIIIMYSMLNEQHRFSRAIIALAVFGSFLFIPAIRLILSKLKIFQLNRLSEMTSAVVGKTNEINEVEDILNESPERKKKLFYINPEVKSENANSTESIANFYTSSLYQFRDFFSVYKPDEIIFCLGSLKASKLIELIQDDSFRNVNIYLQPGHGEFLLRSSSVNKSSDFIIKVPNPSISDRDLRRKRLSDLILSFCLLLLSPMLLFLYRHPMQFLRNIANVILNRAWLTGISSSAFDSKPIVLNAIPEGLTEQQYMKKKIDYLMKYGFEKDLEIVATKLGSLDSIEVE